MTERPTPVYPTALGVSTLDSITLFGRDLPGEMIGKVGFAELAFELIQLRKPTVGEARAFEAVLVSLADHGFVPTAIAARLTYLSAPDSIQGALAAGLLGGGSRFLGVSEDTAAFLSETLASLDATPGDDAGWDEVATLAITKQRQAGKNVPGIGHNLHKNGDPRTPVLFEVARETGCYGDHVQLFAAIGRVAPQVLGRNLPLNAAGLDGAILADLGFPVQIIRGVVLLSRCAGLLGQLSEEMRRPIAREIFEDVEQHAVYRPLES